MPIIDNKLMLYCGIDEPLDEQYAKFTRVIKVLRKHPILRRLIHFTNEKYSSNGRSFKNAIIKDGSKVLRDTYDKTIKTFRLNGKIKQVEKNTKIHKLVKSNGVSFTAFSPEDYNYKGDYYTWGLKKNAKPKTYKLTLSTDEKDFAYMSGYNSIDSCVSIFDGCYNIALIGEMYNPNSVLFFLEKQGKKIGRVLIYVLPVWQIKKGKKAVSKNDFLLKISQILNYSLKGNKIDKTIMKYAKSALQRYSVKQDGWQACNFVSYGEVSIQSIIDEYSDGDITDLDRKIYKYLKQILVKYNIRVRKSKYPIFSQLFFLPTNVYTNPDEVKEILLAVLNGNYNTHENRLSVFSPI